MVFKLGRSSLDTTAMLRSMNRELIATIIENTMFLSHVHIKNFRGIEDLSLSLDDICVLIGENNSGKSSILDAIRVCLDEATGRSTADFNPYDYHLRNETDNPTGSPPIEIKLTFSEQYVDEWPAAQTERLQEAEIIGEHGLRSYVLRVVSAFDENRNRFLTNFDFLNASNKPYIVSNPNFALTSLRRLIPTFYLSSIREAAQEFSTRSKFWRPFARSLQIDDMDRKDLESALQSLNSQILDKHESFNRIKKNLKSLANIMRMGGENPISIDALPSKVFDVLSRARVNLESKTGARIPIERHGGGTQSVAVVCLFEAFLDSQLRERYGDLATAFLALEEPEAHLHPSAIYALSEMLQELRGQKIVSTHSSDFLTGIPLNKVRRLRRKEGKITVYQLKDNTLNKREINDVNYLLRSKRENLLFARCWMLMEGKTEATIIPECARALSYDLVSEGIYCVEYAQVGLRTLLKLADDLGIEWFVLSDGDNKGSDYVNTAKEHLNGRRHEEHIRQLEDANIETLLCSQGFGNIYINSIPDRKRRKVLSDIPESQMDWPALVKDFGSGSKFRNALSVAQRIMDQGSRSVPSVIRDAIEVTVQLARNAE